MSKNSYESYKSIPRSRNSLPGWGRVVLALAVCLGSLGRPAPTYAQDTDPGEFQFLVDVIDPLRGEKPMCIGETRNYLVRILEKGTINSNQRLEDASITLGPGTTVSGAVADVSIVDITSSRTMLINSPSPTRIRPGVVAFTVKAKKPGSTTIDFSAEVSFHNLKIQAFPFVGVPITVQKCKFKASAVLEGAVILPTGDGSYLGMIDGAEMRPDQSNHFTGASPVSWMGQPVYLADDCFVVFDVTPTTHADLAADLDENGQLAVDMDVLVPEISYTSDCYGTRRTGSFGPGKLEPLQLSVPASGGIVTLTEDYGLFTSVVAIVTPEEDEAIALNVTDVLAGLDDLLNAIGYRLQWTR